MISFVALPIGAILILILHLLNVQKKMLFGVFFGTLAFAFFANIVEWVGGLQPYAIGGIFMVDNFTRFFAQIFVLVTGLAALSVIPASEPESMTHQTKDGSRLPPLPGFWRAGKPGMTSEDNFEIILSLLLLATFAMALVAASTGVISLFLSMEFLAIAFYELVALKKDKIGVEAAIKFFVVGVFSSLLFLLGAAFYYGALGTINFAALSTAKFTPFLVASLVLMLAGIGFKMSVFPLNLWLPDVYQGAPSSITAILAGASKKAGFAAYMRLLLPIMLPVLRFRYITLAGVLVSWHTLMGLIAASTMLFGAIAAALQQNVKRLIAYSIISHAGFIAIGLAAGTRAGYQAALLHIAIHALMALGVFAMISVLEEHGLHTLDDYNGIAKGNMSFALVFALFLASLTGVPPLAGFFSKFLLWTSAVHAGMIWLAIVAVVASAISSYFYFIILRRMFGYERTGEAPTLTLSMHYYIPFAIPAALVVIFGFFPQGLLKIISSIF